MSFLLRYHELVVREDIPKLSSEWKDRIRTAIEEKLTTHLELFGKPLRRSLKNYRKLRVGEYRIIFRIEQLTVKIFVTQHRSVVYKVAEKRSG